MKPAADLHQRDGPAALHIRVLLGMLVLLASCATAPPPPPARSASAPSPAPVAAPAPAALTAPLPPTWNEAPGADIRTRNALFRAARFSELPGWQQDDLDGAWEAFQTSCRALVKRDLWQPICARAARQARTPTELRRFFEREFALFRILNIDASRDGDLTGYYEPFINGSLRAEGAYRVPVYATPNDLYTIDWKTIPPDLRRGTVYVIRSGRMLVPVPGRRADSFALDASRFELDTRDRIWRTQLVGERALPYRTRAEIEATGRLDAPVLAYVDDAVALYAMQVQGSGRIRLRDGGVLRLQYAEQNGQPFRPLRVASKAPKKVVTRGLANSADEAESFELEAADATPTSADERVDTAVSTRGVKRPASAEPAPAQASPTATRGSSDGSDALVDQLLGRTQPRPPTSPAASARPTTTLPVTTASPTAAAKPPATAATAETKRLAALSSDPSYVFFRNAPDQSPVSGPNGALGVPLTAGRSIAVDPRVTPLGYPVYIAAPGASSSSVAMQRLVVAQDTGGAIRGAIRADLFWGTGADAGRLAMRTRQRGQMWLMLPQQEAAAMRGSSVVTRGAPGRAGASRLDSECLVADDTFCSESD